MFITNICIPHSHNLSQCAQSESGSNWWQTW